MNQEQFVQRGHARWKAFADLLDGLSSRSTEVRELPHLYRLVARDLAVARHYQLDSDIIDRLNSLVMRAHQAMYAPLQPTWQRIASFTVRGFPAAVRAEARLVLGCAALFYGGAVLAGLLVHFQPDAVYALMDPAQVSDLEAMYDPNAEHFLRPRADAEDLAMFGYYIWNNVSIAFRTFAGGIFAGVGSLVVVLFNGVILGATAAHLHTAGSVETLVAFAIGHSSLELTAIVLSGAAGLRLGGAVTAPGPYRRAEALRRAAGRAAPIVYGSTAMLLMAAVVEAFWSSSVAVPPEAKLVVGSCGWVAVAVYLLRAGR